VHFVKKAAVGAVATVVAFLGIGGVAAAQDLPVDGIEGGAGFGLVDTAILTDLLATLQEFLMGLLSGSGV
jgi:hypothetical protein